MQQHDHTTCPRCGAHVDLRIKARTIKPHRDPAGASCAAEGMTIELARQWVADARATIKAMAS